MGDYYRAHLLSACTELLIEIDHDESSLPGDVQRFVALVGDDVAFDGELLQLMESNQERLRSLFDSYSSLSEKMRF